MLGDLKTTNMTTMKQRLEFRYNMGHAGMSRWMMLKWDNGQLYSYLYAKNNTMTIEEIEKAKAEIQEFKPDAEFRILA